MGIIAMGMGDGHKGFSGPPRAVQGPSSAFSPRLNRTVALKYVHVQYALKSELGADALHGRA